MSDSPLVLTKLRVPAGRSRTVARSRLVDRVIPEPDVGLVLVSAPAGYGKTTLLAEWAQSARQTGAAIAWYALDTEDNEANLFGSYLVASLSQALGSKPELVALGQLLRSAPDIDLQRVLPVVINAVESSERDCVVLFDDYHLISAPAVHSAVAYLLERLPERMRIIIGSRTDPPLPLARLRARGRLAEIRAADLRFTTAETAEFLNEVMRLQLSPDMVAALETRTEGWIAGVQLAALSLSGHTDREGFISSLAGSNRYLVEYLLQEVVEQQPAEVQRFLYATSVLERMCGPLCECLLADHTGAAALLERLEQMNLFVVPLDEEGNWYRYHHLFREFLSSRLARNEPEQVSRLHHAATEWYAAQGLLREAVTHAMQTHDWDYAASIVECHGMATLMHSEIATVYEWCAAFPEEVLQTHPMLCILQGWTLVLGYRQHHCARVEARLQMAERAAAALDDQAHGRWLAGQAAVVRTFIGNAPDARPNPQAQLALAQRALDLLPVQDPLRSTTTLTMGYAHMARHDLPRAYGAMAEARQLSLQGRNYYGVVEATFHQATLAHQQGQLERAKEICRQGWADMGSVVEQPERELPAVGCLDIARGCVLLEQNKLAEGERYLLHGLDLVGWTNNPYYQLTACVELFRLRESQCRSAEALQFLDRIDAVWPDIRFCTEGLRVMHALRAEPDDLAARTAANRWCQAFSDLTEDLEWLPGVGPLGAAQAYYIAALAWASTQATLGKSQLVLEFVARQLTHSEAHGITQRVIELSLLEAQVAHTQGEYNRAETALARALALGESEGYLRVFDQGPAMSRLLADAYRRGLAHAYLRQILETLRSAPDVSSLRAEQTSPSGDVTHLPDVHIETLSERELEVLILMARGASNHAIAEQLVISLGTVKSHVNHILVKVDAHNRTEAVARARAAGLLRI